MCLYVGPHIMNGTNESSTFSVGTLITPSARQSVIKPVHHVALFLSSYGKKPIHNTWDASQLRLSIDILRRLVKYRETEQKIVNW